MSNLLHPELAKYGLALLNSLKSTKGSSRVRFEELINIQTLVNSKGKEMVCLGHRSTEWSFEIEANGCGPSGWKRGIVKTLDRPFWLFKTITLRKACVGHDILYAIGGNEIARLWADNWLHDDIVWRCRRRFTSLWMSAVKAAGYVTANGFHSAVRAGGSDAFNLWTRNYDTELHMTVAS
jgi:hypothetical protein